MQEHLVQGAGAAAWLVGLALLPGAVRRLRAPRAHRVWPRPRTRSERLAAGGGR